MGDDKRKKLENNFYLDEFYCKDRKNTPVPEEYMENVILLAKNLQLLRDEIGNKTITINSAYRTPNHNKKVGGSKSSQHLEAKAADIVVEDMNPREVKEIVELMIRRKKLWFGGVGLYDSFLHVDVRENKARWIG